MIASGFLGRGLIAVACMLVGGYMIASADIIPPKARLNIS
jgi:hypothetical protein